MPNFDFPVYEVGTGREFHDWPIAYKPSDIDTLLEKKYSHVIVSEL